MEDLSVKEIDSVSGGTIKEGAKLFALAGGIGAAAYGVSWGSVAVGVAFAASPIAFVAMVGVAGYAGYRFMKR